MTIVEALRRSKETGESFQREANTGYGGWIRYDPEWEYCTLSAEDLTADDWVPSKEFSEKLTKG